MNVDFRPVRLAYKPYFFGQRTVFFSHNKAANGTFSHDLSAKRTEYLHRTVLLMLTFGWLEKNRENYYLKCKLEKIKRTPLWHCNSPIHQKLLLMPYQHTRTGTVKCTWVLFHFPCRYKYSTEAYSEWNCTHV